MSLSIEKNRKLVIFGAGNFAELAHYFFEHDSRYTVEAFCVDKEYYSDPFLNSIPVITLETLLSDYPTTDYDVFVALGVKDLNKVREDKVTFFKNYGYTVAIYVSSKASVPRETVIRENTMIMEQAIFQPFCTIGANCIIWNLSAIAMKCNIGDNCWIVKGTLGEQVNLGKNTFVGLNAVVAPKASVGEYSILGAHSVVSKDVGAYTVFGAGQRKPSKVKSSKISNRLV